MGHEVIGMEEYVAEDTRPLDRCLLDVARAEIYIGIFAWRYGHIPVSAGAAAATLPAGTSLGQTSITEFELRAALATKPLVFLLDPAAVWPAPLIDAITGENEGGARIKSLRSELSGQFLAGFFTTPEDLARQVAAAVHRRELNDRIGSIGDGLIMGFTDTLMQGGPIHDSTLYSMKASLAAVTDFKALRIDLRDGNYWWSTKLFFLACVAGELTATQLFVFLAEGKRFVGAATPATIRDRLARSNNLLREFDDKCRHNPVDRHDLDQALDNRANDWNPLFSQTPEDQIRILVSVRELRRWLDGDLIERAVERDGKTLSPSFLKAVLDWPHAVVPVTTGGNLDTVVDRTALADYLARLFVKDLSMLALK
jgi:hypothetical protein